MRIALIGPANPYRGGIAKFFDTLAFNMHKQGHTLLIVNFSMQYPSFLFPGKTQYTTYEETPYENRRIINSISPLSWIKSVKAITGFNPDLAIFRYWMPFMAPSLGTIAALISKKRIKTVAIADNIIPHEQHFFDSFLTKYFLRKISTVVCMSKKVESELHSLNYKGKVVYHPHPVYNSYGPKIDRSEACKKLSLDPNFKYILFFGFIREYKGVDILLDAWKLIKNRNDKRLLIAGEFYEEKEKYTKLIDSDDVILKSEYIPENDVNLYFSVADLVVQPYKSASQSGITGIAYNYRVPMIVTAVGGLMESVTDSVEGLVTSVDRNSIAEAIDRFFDDNLKEYFSKNMEKRIGDFSWKGMIDCITNEV